MTQEKFYDACRAGDIKLAKQFIPEEEFDINTGFRIACFNGYREMAEWILTLGANDINGAFQSTCCTNRIEMATWLITLGANDIDKGFEFACYNVQLEMAKWLVTIGANDFNKGFINAFWKGNKEICCWLLIQYSTKIMITNTDVYYPKSRLFIIYCLEQGVSRSIFSNVTNIDQLWKELDENNQEWKELIQPLEINDLNIMICNYILI